MSGATKAEGSFVQKYTWIVFLLISVIFIGFGIGDLLQGADADPAILESVTGMRWEAVQSANPDLSRFINLSAKILGATLLSLSLLTLATTITSFRGGERWAWYALWIWPLWFALVFFMTFTAERSPDFPPPPPMVTAPIFLVITAAVQVLSYRRFFPRSRSKE